jgi:Aspartyl/Asparaginyl beta-hydroxylase
MMASPSVPVINDVKGGACYYCLTIFALAVLCCWIACFHVEAFVPLGHNSVLHHPSCSTSRPPQQLYAGGGGGFGSNSGENVPSKSKINKKRKGKRSLVDTLEDRPSIAKHAVGTEVLGGVPRPFVRSEQNDLIEALATQSSKTCIGRAVEEAKKSLSLKNTDEVEVDAFWDLMPSLIESRFPNVQDHELERVAGMVQHAIDPTSFPLDASIIENKWRPHDEIHAYMPGLHAPQPFLDPSELSLCQQLADSYDTIVQEYETLLKDKKDRFQSVTSMNYESGWKTLVLFYNGHRIPDFPYHLCPTTTRILESVPLAGRIAGFNRQAPSSGIPLHSDGNNMWLTCQMGLKVPPGNKAWIRVGPETRHWQTGQCLVYDTTYEHETMNEHPTEERVVLHVDFFNTLQMTPIEVEVMQYIYSLREEFMKAEGVAKVGKQIL